MSLSSAFKASEPRFSGFALEYSWPWLRAAAGLAVVVLGVGCGSALQSPSPDAGPDGSADVGADASADVSADGALCSGIQEEYAAALAVAQRCMVGTVNACAVSVRASFWCNCMTFANGGADTLAAIAARYSAAGCQSVCNGSCVQVQSLSCLPDTASPTGGRCQVPGVLNLDGADDGGTFSIPVGGEVDITLQEIGPGSYSQQPTLSSDIMTVIDVSIVAGPPNPAGVIRLYRLRALTAGRIQIQIPPESGLTIGQPTTYSVTVDVG